MIACGSVKSWLDINWVYQTGPSVTSGAQRCYLQGLPCLLGEELEHSETDQGFGNRIMGRTSGPLVRSAVICGASHAYWERIGMNSTTGLRTEAYSAVLGGCTLGRLFGNQQIWPGT
jgi:hypothetical protein